MCKSGTRTDSWQTTSRAHENLSVQVVSPQGPFDSAASRVASLLAVMQFRDSGFRMIRIAKRDFLFLILCSNLLILLFRIPQTNFSHSKLRQQVVPPFPSMMPPQRQALLVFAMTERVGGGTVQCFASSSQLVRHNKTIPSRKNYVTRKPLSFCRISLVLLVV